MRQAVLALVHHPTLTQGLEPAHLELLETLQEPGADILRGLVAGLRAEPCQSTAQLLERWRDRPEAERLGQLAAMESLILSPEAARREFVEALSRMQAEGAKRRLDALLDRERESGLSTEERRELQQLMAGRSRAPLV